MEQLIINETPVRTAKNYNINNISIENRIIPSEIERFDNVEIIKNEAVKIQSNTDNIELTFGLNNELLNQSNQYSNQNMNILLDNQANVEIKYKFNKNNKNLVDINNFKALKNTNSNVIIKYLSEKEQECYHNGIIKIKAEENSNVNVIIVNFLNKESHHLLSIENNIEANANVKYTIIDFGGKNSITNYYSNLIGAESNNQINTMYLGADEQKFDLNYIAELRGEKSNIDIEVQGALKDTAKKHFKGTIDFKKGCKKATGNENEACMLLSDTAKSIALPMLLCSEEDVEGNHSSSAGKIGDKELFYIMSRGFEQKEAMKLMVRAKFNKILENIKDEELKNEILEKVDNKLD